MTVYTGFIVSVRGLYIKLGGNVGNCNIAIPLQLGSSLFDSDGRYTILSITVLLPSLSFLGWTYRCEYKKRQSALSQRQKLRSKKLKRFLYDYSNCKLQISMMEKLANSQRQKAKECQGLCILVGLYGIITEPPISLTIVSSIQTIYALYSYI